MFSQKKFRNESLMSHDRVGLQEGPFHFGHKTSW